jgi:hypothetical protein
VEIAEVHRGPTTAFLRRANPGFHCRNLQPPVSNVQQVMSTIDSSTVRCLKALVLARILVRDEAP